MDREPKERVIFDESVYYGDAGEEIAIESLMASEDLTEAEVRAVPSTLRSSSALWR